MDEEEDDFDFERAERKQILDEVMARHPNMVFTGAQVSQFLDEGEMPEEPPFYDDPDPQY